MLLQLAFVLIAIIIGARIGGIGLGVLGGLGLGFGESRQKYYLPESQNDFVFAIICEEIGRASCRERV